MGRLGNQMFQFASTVGIGNRIGLEAKFPIENTIERQPTGPFDPRIGANIPVKCDLTECFDIPDDMFIPSRHIFTNSFYNENEFSYNKASELISDGTCLNGYFQTERYFADSRDLILKYFTFKNRYSETALNYLNKIREENPNKKITSVHVRRGDYLQYPDHHPVCDIEYYRKSILEIQKNSDSIFLIFSDDSDWCKSKFTEDHFIISDINESYSELCAMTLCDNNIIANSSFSWWGAWLNQRQEKKVIAPQKWFGVLLNKNTEDVYCKNWIKI